MDATTSAQSAAQTVEHFQGASALWILPSHWPAQGDLLQMWQQMGPGPAAVLIMTGIVYLLFGYFLFKWLLLINAAIAGGILGAIIGDKFGGASIAGALLGAFIACAITWPLTKYAVAVMGGIFGALLGTSIWRSMGLDPHFAWSGGLTGLVAFGMFSFILFRGSIIMYTSLQGAVMLVFGILGLTFHYPEVAKTVTQAIAAKPVVLPMIIFIPAICGLLYQQHNHHIAATTPAPAK